MPCRNTFPTLRAGARSPGAGGFNRSALDCHRTPTAGCKERPFQLRMPSRLSVGGPSNKACGRSRIHPPIHSAHTLPSRNYVRWPVLQSCGRPQDCIELVNPLPRSPVPPRTHWATCCPLLEYCRERWIAAARPILLQRMFSQEVGPRTWGMGRWYLVAETAMSASPPSPPHHLPSYPPRRQHSLPANSPP